MRSSIVHRAGLAGLLSAGLLLGGPGCLSQHRGLVVAQDDQLLLEEFGGDRRVVDESGEGAYLRGMVGCEVEVESRGRRRLRIESWEVLAGPDGAQPFVGVLQSTPRGWTLDDRSTGQTLVLDLSGGGAGGGGAGADSLAQHLGELVMVTGYVVGTLRVHVVQWRALEPASGS